MKQPEKHVNKLVSTNFDINCCQIVTSHKATKTLQVVATKQNLFLNFLFENILISSGKSSSRLYASLNFTSRSLPRLLKVVGVLGIFNTLPQPIFRLFLFFNHQTNGRLGETKKVVACLVINQVRKHSSLSNNLHCLAAAEIIDEPTFAGATHYTTLSKIETDFSLSPQSNFSVIFVGC